jgi:RNA polymerase sigma-70 factor (ECF subfamily)
MSVDDELERLHPASFGWALACCARNRHEAEDVLQTAYLKVLDGRARFEGRSSMKTWLFAVIRRTAAERRRHFVRSLALRWWRDREPKPEPAPSPEGALQQGETTRDLVRALAALPRRQREVLHLVFYEDLTIEQAADVLEINVGTARTHYQRGKQRMRSLLSEAAR